MVTLLRRAVSTNKRRTVDTELDLDLDLSYIIDGRLIAMGYPATGMRSLYRNPNSQVVRFLQARHGTAACKVYNLCIEPGWQYPPGLLQGAGLVQLPLWDGQAPPLHLVLAFCGDAAAWLRAAPHHVCVVHCKAGKGRTGALVSALLLYLRLVSAALLQYDCRRALDAQALTISSQRRYVSYFAHCLRLPGQDPPPCQAVCACCCTPPLGLMDSPPVALTLAAAVGGCKAMAWGSTAMSRSRC
ncbi:protein-tyrosine phosphatase-like protein [Haematococcus lacustris]